MVTLDISSYQKVKYVFQRNNNGKTKLLAFNGNYNNSKACRMLKVQQILSNSIEPANINSLKEVIISYVT